MNTSGTYLIVFYRAKLAFRAESRIIRQVILTGDEIMVEILLIIILIIVIWQLARQ